MADESADPDEYLRHSWPADAGLANVVRADVRNWLLALGLAAHDADGLVVAVDAAVENAIRHAYRPGVLGSVELILSTEPSMLCIEVLDYGTWRPPDEPATGRGIPLMKTLVQSVRIQIGPERGTRVLLRHPRPPRG